MNWRLILIILVFNSGGLWAQSFELTGKWENDTYKVTYEFRKDGTVIFTQGAATVFVSEYTLNKDQEPAWIDFNVRGLTIPGLIELVDDHTIIIEQFPPSQTHPTAFSEDGGSIVTKHTLTRETE